MNKPKLESLTATYGQEEDSAGRPFENFQIITLSTHDAGGGRYIVIETERWAVDNAEELLALVQDFQAKLANSRNDPN